MSIYHPGYSADDLLALWTVSGGVARYVDMMVSAKALTRKRMLKEIFSQGSSYLSEGKTILAEEFGTDYGIYFTILSGRLDFFEVKRDPARFDAEKLKAKVSAFFRKHPNKEGFSHEIRGLSMEEM